VRAVRRGEALTNPDDAALAVRHAAQLRRLHERHSRWQPLVRLLAIGYLTFDLVRAIRGFHAWAVPSASAAFVSFWLFTEVYGVVAGFTGRGRRLERLQLGERRNRELLQAVGHPDADYDVPVEREARPARDRNALLALGLSASTVICIVVLALLPVMDDRGSTLRLVVFATVALVAIALSLLAIRFARRAWNNAPRGWSKVFPGFAFAVAAATLVAWIVGTINVLFFGA
jgi:hypothetical protein